MKWDRDSYQRASTEKDSFAGLVAKGFAWLILIGVLALVLGLVVLGVVKVWDAIL